MDTATIQAAMASARAAVSLVKGAVDATVDAKLKNQLIQVQQSILDVQVQLADALTDRLDLLTEMDELRRKFNEMEQQRTALDGYELVEIEPGKLLWRSKGAPDVPPHYSCPKCRSNNVVSILQALEGGTRNFYRCSTCSFELWYGARKNVHTQPRRTGGGGWMSA